MAFPESLCSVCTESSLKICKGCHNSKYCSRECQKADWPTHKLLCKTFKDFASRPGNDYRRAIYLPVSSKKPQFIWLLFERKNDDLSMTAHDSPELGTLLGNDKPFATLGWMKSNPVRNKKLTHSIDIRYRDTFLTDGSLPNQSILNIKGSELAHDWRGPMVAYGLKGLDFDPANSDDLDMTDLRHIVDYLLTFNRDGFAPGRWR
jgi:MYND finger